MKRRLKTGKTTAEVESRHYLVGVQQDSCRARLKDLFWKDEPKMATRKKASKGRQNNINTTFSVSSIDCTTVSEKLFGAVESGDAEDGPVVFICGKCKLPVGDSMSWDGSEDEENQIRLKRESETGNTFRILDLESFRRKSRGQPDVSAVLQRLCCVQVPVHRVGKYNFILRCACVQ